MVMPQIIKVKDFIKMLQKYDQEIPVVISLGGTFYTPDECVVLHNKTVFLVPEPNKPGYDREIFEKALLIT